MKPYYILKAMAEQEHHLFERYDLGDDFLWPKYAGILHIEGAELADRLTLGDPTAVPDPSLDFLERHALAIHIPFVDSYRAEIADVIEKRTPSTDPQMLGKIGAAIHYLVDTCDREVLPLFVAQYVITQEKLRLSISGELPQDLPRKTGNESA